MLATARALTVALFLMVAFSSCTQKDPPSVPSSTDAQALLDQTTRDFHNASAEATGAERERLLNEAAKRYTDLVTRFPGQEDIAAQALRGLGSVYAAQGKLDEAVKHYQQVGEKYPGRDWEVLQAWKAAGDLLWEANRRDEAKKYYTRIVERFGNEDASAIIQQVVRGAKARLAE